RPAGAGADARRGSPRPARLHGQRYRKAGLGDLRRAQHEGRHVVAEGQLTRRPLAAPVVAITVVAAVAAVALVPAPAAPSAAACRARLVLALEQHHVLLLDDLVDLFLGEFHRLRRFLRRGHGRRALTTALAP